MTPVVPIEAIIFYMETQILLPGASGGEGEREKGRQSDVVEKDR